MTACVQLVRVYVADLGECAESGGAGELGTGRYAQDVKTEDGRRCDCELKMGSSKLIERALRIVEAACVSLICRDCETAALSLARGYQRGRTAPKGLLVADMRSWTRKRRWKWLESEERVCSAKEEGSAGLVFAVEPDGRWWRETRDAMERPVKSTERVRPPVQLHCRSPGKVNHGPASP